MAGGGAAVIAMAVVAVTYWLSSGGAAARSPAAAFRTADGAAGCVVERRRVTCSNNRAQRRARPVVLQAGGATSPQAKFMVLDWSSAPVLRAGHRRVVGSVRCAATGRQLMCYAGNGSGIAVSAAHMSAVAAAAQYP